MRERKMKRRRMERMMARMTNPDKDIFQHSYLFFPFLKSSSNHGSKKLSYF